MSEDVTFSESDYNLGATSAADTPGLAIIGNCSGDLAVATPTRVRRIADVIDLCESGPLCSIAALLIDHLGSSVILVNSGQTTAGSYGTITKSISGTTDVTGNATTKPVDQFDVVVTVVTGGTVGTTGIEYTYSLDGGLTTSQTQSLGTATSITLPGDAKFDLESAETLVAGDSFTCRTEAPKWNDAQMTAAITALQNYQQPWEGAFILGPITATNVANIETSGTALFNAGDPKWFLTDFRRRNVSGETRAQYLTAYQTAFASTPCKFTSIGYDVVKALSSESVYGSSKWRIKRQMSVLAALRIMSIRPGKDPAHVRLGPMPPAFQIALADGNPDDHDERLFPGVDALRGSSLMSRGPSKPGVYIKNVRIHSAAGSDFEFIQHRRVMNVAERVATEKLELCSGQDVLVNRKTGYILEAEALAIENEVNAALRTALVKPGDVTSARWVCSRSDNLLSTKTLNGELQIIPKAYIKAIVGKASFYNPALNVVES